MRQRVSDTAKWGDVKCGPRVVDAQVKETMRQLLREIQSGQFAKEWIAEHKSGRKNFTRLMTQDESHPVEQVGRQLRSMMPWITGGNQRAELRTQKSEVRKGAAKTSKKRVATRSR
jgi:ketol-acid reductoisomerase